MTFITPLSRGTCQNCIHVVLHCGLSMAGMRKKNLLAPAAALLLSAAIARATAASSYPDQLEMLEWADPEHAAQIIDAAPPLAPRGDAAEINMLEIRGMIYADLSRDEDVDRILRRIDTIGGGGDASAVRAA